MTKTNKSHLLHLLCLVTIIATIATFSSCAHKSGHSKRRETAEALSVPAHINHIISSILYERCAC